MTFCCVPQQGGMPVGNEFPDTEAPALASSLQLSSIETRVRELETSLIFSKMKQSQASTEQASSDAKTTSSDEENIVQELLLQLRIDLEPMVRNAVAQRLGTAQDCASAFARPPDLQQTDMPSVCNEDPVIALEEVAEDSSAPAKRASCDHIRSILEDNSYTLSESVWECIMLTFVPAVGTGASLMTTVAFLTNVIMQMLFVAVVFAEGSSFISASYELESVAEARKWRLTEAHSPDRMDKTNWVALGTRVCGNDGSLIFGNSQMGMLEEIGFYTTSLNIAGVSFGVPMGQTLAFIVLIVWALTICQELVNIIDFFSSLISLPVGKTHVVFHDDTFRVESIGRVRYAVMICITLLRFAVCGALGFAGLCWLSVTSSIENLVLNAAALAFVLDLDELVFNTVCAESVRAPMKTKKSVLWGGLNPTPVLVFVSVFAVACVCLTTWIGEMTDMMRAVKYEMCLRGDLGFVVDVNQGLGYAVVGSTNGENASEPTDAELRASKSSMIDTLLAESESLLLDVTKAFVNEPVCVTCQDKFERPAVYVVGPSAFAATKNRLPAEYGVPSCIDVYNHSTASGKIENNAAILLGVQMATGMPGATCQDFLREGWCDDRGLGPTVRFACSFTCGCGNPYSGLLEFTGCLPPCLDDVKAVLNAHESCRDMSVGELAVTPGVHRYLKSFNSFYGEKAGETIDLAPFEQHGCSIFVFGTKGHQEAFTEDSRWLAMTACGLSPTGASSDAVPFETIRAFCPVACKCVEEPSHKCPAACPRRESDKKPQNASDFMKETCARGACSRPGTFLMPLSNVSTNGLAMPCGSFDWLLKNPQAAQLDVFQCPLFVSEASSQCCGHAPCSDGLCAPSGKQLKAAETLASPNFGSCGELDALMRNGSLGEQECGRWRTLSDVCCFDPLTAGCNAPLCASSNLKSSVSFDPGDGSPLMTCGQLNSFWNAMSNDNCDQARAGLQSVCCETR
eukprot:TRINITY_DN21267_c0_g1_i4.p1 TRINITY_DN21267_c0_g1~~TRINITY_DN21267_c0_g1_i4.p1  ORF type:complete len:967 (-),score=106.38 TRINITY_DN21267_c0_g1_i4:155-3055(-)